MKGKDKKIAHQEKYTDYQPQILYLYNFRHLCYEPYILYR